VGVCKIAQKKGYLEAQAKICNEKSRNFLFQIFACASKYPFHFEKFGTKNRAIFYSKFLPAALNFPFLILKFYTQGKAVDKG